MTTKEFSVLEVCEQKLFISVQTFRNNKEKYLDKLRETDEVEIVKKRPMIIALTPKGKSPQQKADDEFLKIIGCEIGRHDIELLKFILKAILEKKIVPVQEELTHWAKQENLIQSDLRNSVKNYMAFLREKSIIADSLETPVMEIDMETGEILSQYNKKHVNWIYYDYGKNGQVANRKRLDENTQKAFHEVFKKEFAEAYKTKILPLKKAKLPRETISEAVMKLQREIMRELGKFYGIHACERIEEPIINLKVVGKLKQYFGLNAQQKKEITPDFSNVEVIEINRPIGQSSSAIEQFYDYRKLLATRIELYKEGKYAMPLHLYEKWHREFEDRLQNNDVALECEDGVPDFQMIENLKHYKKLNVELLKSADTTETIDQELLAEELDFEKQLNAFILKGEENTEQDQLALMQLIMNKNKSNRKELQPWEK